MNNKRLNILWVGEFSGLNTGFSGISNEMLKRLYATDRYNLFELANYVSPDDHRILEKPWPVFCSMPSRFDEQGQRSYSSSVTAQFGSLVFDKILLENNNIDIVVTLVDDWMQDFIRKSPFRDKFKYIYLSPCDGAPQRQDWIEGFALTDIMLTYSRFAKDLVEKDGIKVFDIVRPSMNSEIYKPHDKNQMRQKYGIPKDAKIAFTCMRNQKRKLFPDLINAFDEYLKLCVKKNNISLALNSFAWFHTSHCDVGYAIHEYVLRKNLGHKILFTYKCNACGYVKPDFFKEEVSICPKCSQLAMVAPGTSDGVNQDTLAELYSCTDLFVQYSICEGLGMCIGEAKSCGIPAIGTDYSAIPEQLEVYGTDKINVKRFFAEGIMETGQWRALPDDEDCAKKIYKYLSISDEERKAMAKSVRKDAVENYSFERAAKIFERAIDSLDCPDHNETWLNPKPNFMPMNKNVPQFSSGSQLVDWCIVNVLGQPEKLSTYWRHCLVKDVNVGFRLENGGRQPFGPNEAINYFFNISNNHNFWENERLKRLRKEDNSIKYELI